MPVPLAAEPESRSTLAGRCHYPDRVIREPRDTILILCDSATIDRQGTQAAFDFGQRSSGSKGRFSGELVGDRLSVASAAIGGGGDIAATGTCEIAYRNDGTLSVIACLVRTGKRWFAVNFVPSRL